MSKKLSIYLFLKMRIVWNKYNIMRIYHLRMIRFIRRYLFAHFSHLYIFLLKHVV